MVNALELYERVGGGKGEGEEAGIEVGREKLIGRGMIL